MAIATGMIWLSFLIILVICIGGILLQIFLSKKDNKILGLTLPIIAFLYSMLVMLNVVAFDSMTAGQIFGVLATTFITSNIPTVVLLAIYFACKEKNKRKNFQKRALEAEKVDNMNFFENCRKKTIINRCVFRRCIGKRLLE